MSPCFNWGGFARDQGPTLRDRVDEAIPAVSTQVVLLMAEASHADE